MLAARLPGHPAAARTGRGVRNYVAISPSGGDDPGGKTLIGMMEPEVFTAERYRQEAARVRRAAMAMRDQFVRRGMLSVADQYDGLAEKFVESRRFAEHLPAFA